MNRIAQIIRTAALATMFALLQGCPVTTEPVGIDPASNSRTSGSNGNAAGYAPFFQHCTYTHLSNGMVIKSCHGSE